jgi:hypothetical protein
MGDEDAVVTPEVPTGSPVRKPIFNDEANGQVDDPTGIMAAGRSEVGHVGVEVTAAAGAVVLRVDDQQAAWPVTERTAEVVQRAATFAMTEAGAVTTRTSPTAIVTRAVNEQRLGEVFNAGDPLGAVGDILSRSHGWLLSWARLVTPVKPPRRRNSRTTQFPCYSLGERA